MMNQIDVSIILVTYNTMQMTFDCIQSILSQTKKNNFEIILVDNASSDGSREFFSQNNDIVYIYNDRNLGFGRANNIGIKRSLGKYVFLLNTDTILVNDAISYFVDYERNNGNEVVLGSWLLDSDMNICHSYGRFPTFKSELSSAIQVYTDRVPFMHGKYHWKEKVVYQDLLVDYITGADLFIPKTVIDSVGLIDERYFMYYEETDWQNRMASYGYKRKLIVGPQIIHLEQGSQNQGSKIKTKNMNKLILTTISMLSYFKKNNHYLSYLNFKYIYFLLRFPAMVFNEFLINEKFRYFTVFFTKK